MKNMSGEMNKYTFFVPRRLPTMNEIIGAAKVGYHTYREMKKEYTELVAGTIGLTFRFRKLNIKRKVWISLVFVEKNKRYDPDNIVAAKKFILDGIVKAGMLKKDGWAEIAGFTETWEVGKEPGIWVEVREIA